MSGKLKYLAVATAAIGVLALVNTARTWNYRDKLFHGVKARDGLLLQGAAARWDR